ncbi:MAG TPA: DUF4184 family protein [Gemmatimonas sp.]|uniref:DUF4184 family protein n=1 Tax=Gemmatimonas sp. TaxID=1962908 RepID=UPI002ED825D1
MPATILSHQALVLPLKMRWPHRFSGLALCIGSMAPDLEFIGRMSHDWLFSHTLSAQLWFTVPLTMALVWVLTTILLPVLVPYLRDHPEWRLHDLLALRAPVTWRDWASVACSAWIGGVSHVVLDGITHGNHSGWLVPWLPVLRTPVPHFGGDVPLHDALQCWLTIGFALLSVRWWRHIARKRLLWTWRGASVVSPPRQCRRVAHRLLVLVALAATAGATIGGLLMAEGHGKAAAAAIAFGALDVTFVALMISASWLARQRVDGRMDTDHHAGGAVCPALAAPVVSPSPIIG